jgi:8-oxo-dGTP pyrophosphatase MutT (NUDIX family)
MTDPALERPGWLDTLTDSLSEQSRLNQVVALRPGIGARPAAVLILIGEGPEGPEIMFVERAAGLRNHAGQIAFPGGAAEIDDHDLADTALREAAEETGVDRSGIDVLGVLPPAYVEVSGFDVTAVIGWWRDPSPVAVMDTREAASIDIVPVAVLTDPAHRARVRHPSGYTGPAFEVNGHLIWGLTAHLLDGVLDLAGWQRPWDRSRELPIPLRYLTDRRPNHGGPDAH